MPKQKLQDDKPIRQKLGVVAVGGDPHSTKLAAALADKAPVVNSEESKQFAKDLRKKIASHPVYALLSRAATSGELPHQDELASLNLTQSNRQKLIATARRIKHEAESPLKADEERDKHGVVRVTGYTSPVHLAKQMAWDVAEEVIKSLPSNHETQQEQADRQAANDSEAVADRVWNRVQSGAISNRAPEPFPQRVGGGA